MCDLYRPEREPNFSICDECGGKVHVGDHPICAGKGMSTGHLPTRSYQPFRSFWTRDLAKRKEWEDPVRGTLIDSDRKHEKVMRKGDWVIPHKNDSERPHPGPSAAGFSEAFNRAARETHGHLGLGDVLRDDD